MKCLQYEEMQNWLTGKLPMRLTRGRYSRLFIMGPCLAVVLLGCARSAPRSDAEHERNPWYQKAKESYQAGDYQKAAGFYEQALLDDPTSAPAHLELGLVCDEKLGDPIAAIYHYQQYLKLRPGSGKQPLVQDFIERARLSLAAKVPLPPTADPNEVARLRSENAALAQENMTLRAKVAEWEKVAAASSTAVTQVVTAPREADQTEAVAGKETARPRTHVVEKGDTLQSLALRYYGTRSAWDRIYQANRSILANKDQLKIGQQLVLP